MLQSLTCTTFGLLLRMSSINPSSECLVVSAIRQACDIGEDRKQVGKLKNEKRVNGMFQ